MMEEKKIFVNIANSEILEVSDMAMENTESITWTNVKYLDTK